MAGTGKSTLAHALIDRHPDWRLADFIHARQPGHWPYFVHSAPRLARLLASSPRRPAMSWDEVKLCVYASEWHRYLDSEHGSGVTLIDQGPAFALARLLGGKSAVASSSRFQAWRHETAARWAVELDAVVELTAADDVLLERINAREKDHEAKGKAASAALDVLADHRRAYADVLDELEGTGHLRRVRIDTSERRPEMVAEEVSAMLSTAGESRLTERTPLRNVRRARLGTWARGWK